MNTRKLVLSIGLGAMLTVGLLVGFSLGGASAIASSTNLQVSDLKSPSNAIRAQEAVSSAHIVVVLSGEKAAVRAITWTGTISRVTGLELAGFDVENSGDAVCGIEGEGCPASDCFCDDNNWWQGVWDASSTQWDSSGWPPADLRDGDVVGFHNGAAWKPPVLPAPSYVGAFDALDWLRQQQQADGSFGTPNYTAEVLMGVSANGVDGSTWSSSPSLLANVLSNGAAFASSNAAGAGKLAVALTAQESCWPIGAPSPLDHYYPTSGTFSVDTLYQAWGILGTATLSDTIPVSAVQSLKASQQANGGWELFAGFGTDTNSTALALQALVAAGEPVTSTSIVSGLTYLEKAQNADGGFPYSPDSPWGTDSDTNSTAYVVQALFATDEDPLTGTWSVTSSNPISYLLSMQLDDGSFEWQTGFGSDQIATQQAIPALLHRPVPMRVDDLDACYGISGQVVGGVDDSASPLTGVGIEAAGAGDQFFATAGADGAYTISVQAADTYTLTPCKEGFVFTPTVQSVEVAGAPGTVASALEFAGETYVYLPLVVRQ